MELLALFSNREDSIVDEIKKALNKFTLYPLRTIDDFEDLNTNIHVNLLIIDTVSHRLSSIDDILSKLDNDRVILIFHEKPDKFTLENLPQSVYDCVETQSIHTDLPVIVERAIENQKLKNELNLLKQARDNSMPEETSLYNRSDMEMFSGRDSLLSGKDMQEKVLVNFAKMLTVSFDTRKLFDHFMDSVKEIARVSKMSVMLRDKDGFYVSTHYGLDPYIVENLMLKKDSALAVWLARTGKIMHKPVNPADTSSMNIKSEMEFLQSTFSFPMINNGKLIGIFNINNKITEEPLYKEELEIIYIFCNYLATAVKDIDLYHQIRYQKEFTNNVLACMNSGMIAIDKEEKITVFNQQAAEFLNLNSSGMIGSDLRNLPSPLGDILYETMIVGTSYKRFETEINPRKMPIGINSFRLIDENQSPLGAGIVFTDLSDSKKLENQERRTEKLETVNNLMAKIAHEVRTPLTSIQTYTQIMNEKYSGDEDLQNFFSSTVVQSIHNLDSLIDKLVIFSSKPEYNFNKEDVNKIINEAGDYISKNIQPGYDMITQGFNKPFFVKADRKLLIKALYYIALNIIDKSADETLITMDAKVIMRGLPSVEISMRYEGNELTAEERQNMLKPLEDIKNLGSELNVPISHQIIESHNGSLEIKSENGNNIFIVRLPGIDRRNSVIPVEEKQVGQ